MINWEKEMKILNIDVEEIKQKLESIGAVFVSDIIQEIYVYDIVNIYSRYLDVMHLMNNITKRYQYNICKDKLRVLLFEIDQLVVANQRLKINAIINCENLMNILDMEIEDAKNKLNILGESFKEFNINPNKWIRLRRTGKKTSLTIKHIVKENENNEFMNFQNVSEVEMEISSIEEGKNVLEQLGFAFRNYQEKRRISYIIKDIKVDIDIWPMIPAYIEIEGEDYNEILEIGKILGFNIKDFKSCNTEEVYKFYGINLYDFRELKLD